MPRVSVILTFFNNLDFVDTAIDQVLAQSFTDYELLVVDDGSTDGTREALARRTSEIPAARYIANPSNLGVAASRNNAVQQSRGEFVWFVDCDDVWSPRILEVLTNTLDDADVAVCGAVRVHDRSERIGKQLDGSIGGSFTDKSAIHLLLTGGIRGYLWNKLFRRSLLVANPFPHQSSQSDFATVTEIVFTGAKVNVTAECHYWHVERRGSITNSKLDSFANMDSCLERVEILVAAREDAAELAPQLRYFRQWFYRSSIVNTTIRLGTTTPALRSRARELQRAASLSDLANARRFSNREAAIAALMRVTGPLYATIYRRYLARAS